MLAKLFLLALVGGSWALSIDTPLKVTCATMKCSTGACVDTLSGPKCVKPGSCPTLKPGTIGTCVEMCSGDTACDGDKKCCSNGCGHVCTDPVKDALTIKPSPVVKCATMKCSAGHVCVDLPTGGKCVPTTRSGTCPLVLCAPLTNGTMAECDNECEMDSDCKDSSHKCCKQCGCKRCAKPLTLSLGCATMLCLKGTKCVETPTGAKCVNDTVQLGDCPLMRCPLIASLMPVTCKPDACDSDDDCEDDETCCKDCNRCGFCHKPPKAPSCDDIECKPGHVCELQKVVCVKAPCHAVPTCVMHKCLQPKQPGLCKAIFPSWFFDTNSRKCMQFNYGGCGGNDNRFSTEKECKKACRREVKCPKDDKDEDCKKKHECSRRAGRNLPVCPQGQSCCRTSCGRKCKVPVFD